MPKKPVSKTLKLMPIAREIANAGLCLNFKGVCEDMQRKGLPGLTLKLWATASDRDEIDRICQKAREHFRKR